MPVSLSPSMIQGVVIAIIVFLIQLLFLEFLVLANANMQREISDHCDFGSFTSIKVRSGQLLRNAGTVKELTKGANCGLAGAGGELIKYAGSNYALNTGGPSAGDRSVVCGTVNCVLINHTSAYSDAGITNETWYSEDGNEIINQRYRLYTTDDDWGTAPSGDGTIVSKTAPAGTWKSKPGIVNQFHGIISIIGEIIPLLLVVAVASEAFMLVYLRNSQGGISGVVSGRVALLVIAYVVILFGGTVFEFAENALVVFTSTAVSGTDRFRDIAQLLLSLVPLAYELLVLGILCLLYTSPSPRDRQKSRMPSSA